MRIKYLLLVFGAVIIALGAGLLFDRRIDQVIQNPLQVPDNIDYYLARVNYQAFDEQGKISYQLQSPYLEHYIREDTSQLTEPQLRYYKADQQWKLDALSGRLNHPLEQLIFTEKVRMQRERNSSQLLLTTEKIIFSTQSELIEIPHALTLTTDTMKLQAANASLDIKHEQHQFQRVKAIYEQNKTNEAS